MSATKLHHDEIANKILRRCTDCNAALREVTGRAPSGAEMTKPLGDHLESCGFRQRRGQGQRRK